MLKKLLVFLCVCWLVMPSFSEAIEVWSDSIFYSLSDKKIIFQDEDKVIVNFDITNDTSDYYPELFCVPTLKIYNEGDLERTYYEYEPKTLSLEPNEAKTVTLDCKIPKNIPNKKLILEIAFYLVPDGVALSEEKISLEEQHYNFNGFLEDESGSYWKMNDGSKVDINSVPTVEANELPQICLKLKSTFDVDKKIYPQYRLYEKSKIFTDKPIYTGNGEATTFKSGEEKELILDLPMRIKPESYLMKLNFTDDSGKVISATYNYSYNIVGDRARIEGITFDPLTKTIKGYVYGSEGSNSLVEMMVYGEDDALLNKTTKNVTLGDKANLIETNIDNYNGSKVNVKIKVSSNSKILCEKEKELNTIFTNPKTIFSDISGKDCEKQVKTLNGLGIINGYIDNTFKPDNLVTRAEFAVIVTKLMDIKTEDSGETLFSDCDGYWAQPYIDALYKNGFISGYPDGTFRPQNNVTYQEAVTILLNALGYRNKVNDGKNEWPYNYIIKALELSITRNTSIQNWSKAANRGDISIITLNSYFIK